MVYNRSPLRSAGHVAGAAGAYRLGHALRAAGSIGDMLGLESFAASIGAASVALVGIGTAAATLKVSFDALSTTATSLVGAISQLGGAKGLQQMMVEAVTNQQLISQTRFTVAGAERLSSSELNTLGNNLSENILNGAFSKNEYLAGIKQIGTETGMQKSLSEDTLGFIGRFAKVGGMGFEESASIFSRLKKQNMSLSDSQIQNMMLAGHAIGQSGSFNIQELPDASKLLQRQGLLGSTGTQAVQDLFMAGTLLKAGGAANLEEAGTQLGAFLKAVEVRGATGPFKLDINKHLQNMGDAFSYIANTPAGQMDKALMTGRSALFVSNIASAINQRAGTDATDFSPEAKTKRQSVIDDMEKMHMTMADLNKEFEESLTPADRFKVSFNKISDNLEAQFLPVLQKMEPIIELFAEQIKLHAEDIGGYFTKMAGWFMVLIEHLPQLADLVISLAQSIAKVIVWFVSLLPNHSDNLEDAKKMVQRQEKNVQDTQEGIKTLLTKGIEPPSAMIEQLKKDQSKLADAKLDVVALSAMDALSGVDAAKEAKKNATELTDTESMMLLQQSNAAAHQKLIDDQKARLEANRVTHSIPQSHPDSSKDFQDLKNLLSHIGGHASQQTVHLGTLVNQGVTTPSAPTTNTNGS